MSRAFPRNCWRQLSYAIKNQLVASKTSLGGILLAPHWFTYPYAIKNQRGASKIPHKFQSVPKPIVGGFGWDELVLYGIRELAPATLSTNESQASTFLDQ